MSYVLCEARALRAARLVALCALAVLPLVGLFAATPAAPAPTPTPAATLKIGVIDLDRIMSEYDGAKLAQMRLEGFRKEREGQFNSLQLGIGLPEKDFDAYQQDVLSNSKLDQKHIKAQQDLAKKNMDEYQALKDKKEPLADKDKTRLAQLEANLKTAKESLKAVYDSWSHDMDSELNRYLTKLNETMDAAITEDCKAKKYAVVLNKNVKMQENAVRFVWGGTDITEEVVKLMNDHFKPTMFDMPPADTMPPAAGPATPVPPPATPPTTH